MTVERYVPEHKKKLATIDKKKLRQNARPASRKSKGKHGGARPGTGGRGTPKRDQVKNFFEKYPVMPLDHMLTTLNSQFPKAPKETGDKEKDAKNYREFVQKCRRLEARMDDMAKAAAPFCHARLANIEMKSEQTVKHALDLTKLTMEELKQLERITAKSQVIDLDPYEYDDITDYQEEQ